jgi:hypothetical protein
VADGVVAVVGARGGSRADVAGVCRAIAIRGRVVAVGCAVGVDAMALRSVPVGSLRVFAVFGPAGAGAVPGLSNVGGVLAVAGAGGSVAWLAGGGLGVPVCSRLGARTAAVVGSASALVAFPGRGASSGSWLAVRLALAAGLPVVVFPDPVAGVLPASVPGFGPVVWSPAGGGVWASGWRASPAQGGF